MINPKYIEARLYIVITTHVVSSHYRVLFALAQPIGFAVFFLFLRDGSVLPVSEVTMFSRSSCSPLHSCAYSGDSVVKPSPARRSVKLAGQL